jgi:hypothetical protein
MKLAKPENPVTAKILYMFDMLSLDFASWKPVCMYATRNMFYVVAKGFGLGRQGYKLLNWLQLLKMLWVSLTFNEVNNSSVVRAADLDFIATDMELETFKHWLLQLSAHILEAQVSSLHGWKQEGL